MSDDPRQRSDAMRDADVANGEGPDQTPAVERDSDPDAPGTAAAAPTWPADAAEPNEPG